MVVPRVVIDTNVIIAALRSQNGYSHRLLMSIGTGLFDIAVSVPLVLEYEAVAKRFIGAGVLTTSDVEVLIDYICSVAVHQRIYYLWRPFLADSNDDMVLEVAVAAGCDYIVTYDKADFRGVERFHLTVVDAREFLQLLGVRS